MLNPPPGPSDAKPDIDPKLDSDARLDCDARPDSDPKLDSDAPDDEEEEEDAHREGGRAYRPGLTAERLQSLQQQLNARPVLGHTRLQGH